MEKYHINGLLCPRWGLPIHRRGALDINLELSSVIFDVNRTEEFLSFKSDFEKTRYAPYQIVMTLKRNKLCSRDWSFNGLLFLL